MKIDANSRIVIFAPHPDDEALATAGVLQRVATSGASVHIVFVTNGDNNPWPHRVLERRWKIKPADRLLWAARRVDEALASLSTLGISSSSVEFLWLPDQRITELFLHARLKVLARLTHIIEQAAPNLVFAPSPFDLHPDHSAVHLFLRGALARAGRSDIEQLYYMVHTRGYHSDWSRIGIKLSAREQALKKRAILCHRTQIALSRRRFLRHATRVEEFWRPAPPRAVDFHHPVRGGQLTDDGLVLQLQRRKRSGSFARCTLLLAVENESGRGEAFSIGLLRESGAARICDASTGAGVGFADLEVQGAQAQLVVPLELPARPVRLFAKLKEPSVFFDPAGWRELPALSSRVLTSGPLVSGSAEVGRY